MVWISYIGIAIAIVIKIDIAGILDSVSDTVAVVKITITTAVSYWSVYI